MTGPVLFAFGLTLFAGLSTGIGSALAFFHRKFNPQFLAGSLGFSAGVMIYVSLVEILAKARVALALQYGDQLGYALAVLSFFLGIAVVALIDAIIPSHQNPHEYHDEAADDPQSPQARALLRMGVFSALAIAIHNFPEGLATFIGALHNPAVGMSIAFAIAIHNIPEGVAVSVPIYFATRSRRKAFLFSFASGIAEPIGAVLGYLLFVRWLQIDIFGFVFAAVAGIMVYISLDELFPTAERYGKHHIAIGGVMLGMLVMAVSLVLFV